MLAIYKRLSVVALDDSMRSGHLRRLVIRQVALDLFATLPDFRFLFLQKLVQAFHLLQQTLVLLVVSVPLSTRQPILLEMLRDHLVEFRL